MQWYQTIVKRMLSGIIFFLVPLILLVFILGKAIHFVQRLILPIKKYLPAERVMGIGLLTLISIILILFICYIAGVLSQGKRVRSLISKLEDNVLVFVPGYAMIKSRADDAISETDDKWRAVLVDENNGWRPGIEVDRQPGGFSTVFFPSPPSVRSGTLKLVHESKVKNLHIPVATMMKIVRKFGEGSASWLNDEKMFVRK